MQLSIICKTRKLNVLFNDVKHIPRKRENVIINDEIYKVFDVLHDLANDIIILNVGYIRKI